MIKFKWTTLGGRHRIPLIRQMESAECGLACLAMIASYHGVDIGMTSMRRRFGSSMNGMSLSHMLATGHALGFTVRPIRGELKYLLQSPKPCILHWDLNHFVVLCKGDTKGILIHDPARGRLQMSMIEASHHFTGVLLELTPAPDLKPERSEKRIPWRRLTGDPKGVVGPLLQLTLLTFAIELLSLSLPFHMQWVMDSVLVTQDTDLLLLITLGFATVVVAQAGIGLIRAWVISWLGASLVSQWIGNLFSHLLRLPADFFEKRHIGDVVSRFSSTATIQATLTGSLITALLDGVLGMFALLVMTAYSVKLTLIVFSAFATYGILRAALYPRLRRANEDQLVFSARQQTELMESVRGIKAIKLANKQAERTAKLKNATVAMAERGIVAQRAAMGFQAVSQLIFGLERVVLIAVGSYMVIGGTFSAGMVVAFLAYADHFSRRAGSFIDNAVELRMIRMHGERIADIVLAEVEQDQLGSGNSKSTARPLLSVRDVSFRYSEAEPFVLQNISFSVRPGESLAITGDSGSGKSTLIKLLLGLLEPTQGTIEIDSTDIRRYGLSEYRSLIGAVLQEDCLFAGAIADNIAFFYTGLTIDRVIKAARTAQVHDDIMRMPMAYESLVGDMGSSLSGGQRQRVLIARALYRDAKILILDEATSHLDEACETRVDQAIRNLEVSRIIVSHRTSTIAMADRIIRLDRTGAVELSTGERNAIMSGET